MNGATTEEGKGLAGLNALSFDPEVSGPRGRVNPFRMNPPYKLETIFPHRGGNLSRL